MKLAYCPGRANSFYVLPLAVEAFFLSLLASLQEKGRKDPMKESPMKATPLKSMALRFVLLVGVMSFFADFTYEGSRGIVGPYLALLGASAVAVASITGLG